MSTLIDRLKPPPHKPEISDPATVKTLYDHWRNRVFYSMYVGYALYYLTRKCLAFAMPALIQDLGYDKGQLGIMTTTLAISYGISKFVSGLIGDRSNPRYFMAAGLIATGIFNIFFGLSSSLITLAAFWGIEWMVPGVWLALLHKAFVSLVFKIRTRTMVVFMGHIAEYWRLHHSLMRCLSCADLWVASCDDPPWCIRHFWRVFPH